MDRVKGIVVGALAATAVTAVAACGTSDAPGGAAESTDGAVSQVTLDPSERPPEGVDPMAWFGERIFPLVAGQSAETVNPVYSPLSVYLALAMAADGARGETAAQFAQVLAGDREAVNGAAAELLADYAQFDGAVSAPPEGTSEEAWAAMEDLKPKVRVADSVWIDEGLEVREEFRQDMEKIFGSVVEEADLQDPKTVERVNRWVSDQTEGLIKQILSQEEATDLLMYLVNAVYFNGQWTFPASADETAPGDFTAASGGTVRADMMTFDYGGGGYLSLEDGTEGALLRYGSGRFALLAVMPGDGVDAVEWDGAVVAGWLGQIEDKEPSMLTVELPKWEADSGKLDLIPVLQAAGLTDVFGAEADLSGIAGEPGDLLIDIVSHRAVGKVDEKGTEAAAVTGVGIAASLVGGEPVSVRFDQPFVYSIVDTETGLPLFLGVVGDPTAG
jgi:serpin B